MFSLFSFFLLNLHEIVDKLLNFIDCETFSTDRELLEFLILMETGRKGDLESEPAGILWLGSQILVKSQFNMREVRQVKDVEDMLRILRRTFLEQHAIVSAC